MKPRRWSDTPRTLNRRTRRWLRACRDMGRAVVWRLLQSEQSMAVLFRRRRGEW